jgi:hypothetical protein
MMAKLYRMLRINGMKIIPAARIVRKYHERIAVNSLDPALVEAFVTRRRMHSRELMEQREQEIEDGLVHYSPAVARDLP